MIDLISKFVLLAEDQAPQQQQGQQQGVDSFASFLIPVAMLFAVFYFVLLRPQRREQAKRDTLLKALKKNDRVVTAGGIIGTVANLNPDGKEVTLKVDDSTRIRMLRSSIQSVLTDDDSSKSEGKT